MVRLLTVFLQGRLLRCVDSMLVTLEEVVPMLSERNMEAGLPDITDYRNYFETI